MFVACCFRLLINDWFYILFIARCVLLGVCGFVIVLRLLMVYVDASCLVLDVFVWRWYLVLDASVGCCVLIVVFGVVVVCVIS